MKESELVVEREEKVPFSYAKNRVDEQVKERKKEAWVSKEERTGEERERSRRAFKQKLRKRLLEKRKRANVSEHQTKGQRKVMAKKGEQMLKSLKGKKKDSIKFERSNKFFANLEKNKEKEKAK